MFRCSAPGEDSKENVAMQEWILKSVIMHTEECVLVKLLHERFTEEILYINYDIFLR